MVLTRSELFAWKPRFSDYVYFLVIQEVKNTGSGWAEVADYDSDWTIYAPDGSVVTTNSFTYVYPDYLGPSETGYLIDDGLDDSYPVDDYSSLEVDGRYSDAPGPDPQRLEVLNTKLRSSDGEVEVTGQVENVGTEAVEDAHAGAVYFDASGNIIGASWTNLIENVDVGQKKAFETIGSNPLRLADVDHFVVLASADF